MFDRHFVGKLRLKKKIYSSTNGVNSTEMIENLSNNNQFFFLINWEQKTNKYCQSLVEPVIEFIDVKIEIYVNMNLTTKKD